MQINSITVKNYKSFFRSTTLQFKPGFNVLVGANSSGKSALTSALGLLTDNRPHDSPLSRKSDKSVLASYSTIEVEVEFPVSELANIADSTRVVLPHPINSKAWLAGEFDSVKHSIRSGDIVLRHCFSGGSRTVKFGLSDQPRAEIANNAEWSGFVVEFDENGTPSAQASLQRSPDTIATLNRIVERVRDRIFRFVPERPSVPHCQLLATKVLEPELGNLASCVNLLSQTNRELFDELNRQIRQVFPTIERISAPATREVSGHVELRCIFRSPHESSLEFSRLIREVGSGVANVVATLYLCISSRVPQVIVLEEPSNYLHPRALREFLRILSNDKTGHQFFITTHSSEVLRSIKPATLTFFSNDGAETKVRQELSADIEKARSDLFEIGIRATDLHGYDFSIWVEGPTETAVFSLVIGEYFPEKAERVAFPVVPYTSDFGRKSYTKDEIERFIRIYSSAAIGTALVPPLFAILIDREDRDEKDLQNIERKAAHRVRFLPCTMIEDYFLHESAVAHVFNSLSENVGLPARLSAKVFAERLAQKRTQAACSGERFHSANFLIELFRDISESKMEYRKVEHGMLLAEWIVRNDRSHFEPLSKFLNEIVEGAKR